MDDELPTRPAAPSAGEVETVRLAPSTAVPPAGATLTSGMRLFDRYTLEAVLGRGGMAVVWRARDETLGETVALKFLPEAVARDAEAIDELKEETRRARKLTHPNIVRIHDFVRDATLAAVSMECIEGETLGQRRLAQPDKVFSTATLAPFVVQLCAALEYAHGSAKLVHRDLKPGNLLVTRDGHLKVTDFGIACGLSEASTRLTAKAGRTSGTLVYVSPQQLLGEKPAATDDIYALGATLYELLTSKPPFFRGDPDSLILQVRQKPPLALAAMRRELGVDGEQIPPTWEKTIAACLAKQPEERPATAREVLKRLGLATSVPPRAGEPVTAPRKTGLMGALVGAIALIGVVGGGWWWRSQTSRAAPASAAVASDAGFVVSISPAEAAAQITLGVVRDRAAQGGQVVVRDLADGEHDLIVKAPGYFPFGARVTTKNGRGAYQVALVPMRGELVVSVQPGSSVSWVDARGRETLLGRANTDGLVHAENILVAKGTIKVEHPDYEPALQSDVAVAGEAVTKVTVAQKPLPGELRVFSVPSNADVTVNGIPVGKTPATLRNQPAAQPLAVEVSLRGYRVERRSVTLKPREAQALNVGTLAAAVSGLELRPADGTPPLDRAVFKVDGRDVRAVKTTGTAWMVDGLDPGSREVELALPKYEVWKKTVSVRDAEIAVVPVTLTPLPAMLTLKVTGPAEYVLLIDGTEAPVVSGQAQLAANRTHVLEVRAANFTAVTRTLTLGPTASENWQVVLGRVSQPAAGAPWTNPIGMKFVPVPGTDVLCAIWETRAGDYERFARVRNAVRSAPGPEYPISNVSWDDAQAFCRWLTDADRKSGSLLPTQRYRLPTDAEWSAAVGLPAEDGYSPAEKHNRITDVYPWGSGYPPPKGAGNFADEALKRARSDAGRTLSGYDDGFEATAPVGSFAPNALGIYDLAGNVREWCEDLYQGGTEDRVIRGSGFNHLPTPSAWRQHLPGDRRGGAELGFRCVVELVPPRAAATPTVASAVLGQPTKDHPWENSLQMKFVPVPGTKAWFSIWDVRNQDFAAFAKAKGMTWTALPGDEADYPAVRVSRAEAQAFCRWLTDKERAAGRLTTAQRYRLPTDAEWSCAVGLTSEKGLTPEEKHRNGDPADFVWGRQWPPPRGAGNFLDESARGSNQNTPIEGYDDGYKNRSPVGRFTANEFGLYDMVGNVWQWCDDDLASGACVLRGGSYISVNPTVLARSARFMGRETMPADARQPWWGFRPVLEFGAATALVEPSATVPRIVASDATKDRPWENSLGMKFAPVPGTNVWFSIWDARNQDFATFARAEALSWKPYFNEKPNFPAVQVSWLEAQEFCRWLTKKEKAEGRLSTGRRYRLPTDREWSLAVGLTSEKGSTPAERYRNSDDHDFIWGRQWPPPPTAGNFLDESAESATWRADSPVITGYRDGFSTRSPVGSFAANQLGLYDIVGNVWQWCEDDDDADAGTKVLRGGSYSNSEPRALARGSRYRVVKNVPTTDARQPHWGFRPVLELEATATVGLTTPSAVASVGPVDGGTPARQNSLGMKFVAVPGVAVLFSIWETRVQDFEVFVRETGEDWPRVAFPSEGSHPVTRMTRETAREFCAWLTKKEAAAGQLRSGERYRLPSDAEWSAAVGLGNETGATPREKGQNAKPDFPWGSAWPPPRSAGNFSDEAARREKVAVAGFIDGYDDGFAYTAPVGSFAPNRFGLFDLSGNAFEWVDDDLGADLGTDNRAGVVRGGSFRTFDSGALVSAARNPGNIIGRNAAFGFRCVLELQPKR
jgi:formylglycine-generating enzyme required for sulfatase activity